MAPPPAPLICWLNDSQWLLIERTLSGAPFVSIYRKDLLVLGVAAARGEEGYYEMGSG